MPSHNTPGPYRDGYIVGLERGGDIEKNKRAIVDCQWLGWSYLEKYFEGKVDGIKQRERDESTSL